MSDGKVIPGILTWLRHQLCPFLLCHMSSVGLKDLYLINMTVNPECQFDEL